jgi:threonine dehydratase
VKIEKTRFYGGEIIFYDRYTEDRAAVRARIAEDRNLVLVPPYGDPDVLAGQRTLGLEMASQAAAMGAELDALLVCCSGGGLKAGCALAMEAESPATAVYSAEPAGFDDTLRSLTAGHRVTNEPGSTSICDAILIDKPGELTFPINKRLLVGGVVINDKDALEAMALAYEEFKIVVEPGGAVALAAVISGQLDCRGRTVGVVCSGGNVSTEVFRSALDLVHTETSVAQR